MGRVLQFLLTIPLPDDPAESELVEADLADGLPKMAGHFGGEVSMYEPPEAVEKDAYGNPYDAGPVDHTRGQAKDAYGNWYDKASKQTADRDAYGNPYNKTDRPKFKGKKDNYGNPHLDTVDAQGNAKR